MTEERMRHARMKIDSAAWISHGSEAWSSELADISATGVRVKRPANWTGKLGEVVSLDMLVWIKSWIGRCHSPSTCKKHHLWITF